MSKLKLSKDEGEHCFDACQRDQIITGGKTPTTISYSSTGEFLYFTSEIINVDSSQALQPGPTPLKNHEPSGPADPEVSIQQHSNRVLGPTGRAAQEWDRRDDHWHYIPRYCFTHLRLRRPLRISKVNAPEMDHTDYPWEMVPKTVEKPLKTRQSQDQRQCHYRILYLKEKRTKLEDCDCLTPIEADGETETGFNSMTSTVTMTKLFVKRVVRFLPDGRAIGKKFKISERRTVVPFSECEDRPMSARMQLDIMGYISPSNVAKESIHLTSNQSGDHVSV